ncbi:MAG: hypothetical protein ACFWUC_11715 [Oscillospiraceae bacterium]
MRKKDEEYLARSDEVTIHEPEDMEAAVSQIPQESKEEDRTFMGAKAEQFDADQKTLADERPIPHTCVIAI